MKRREASVGPDVDHLPEARGVQPVAAGEENFLEDRALFLASDTESEPRVAREQRAARALEAPAGGRERTPERDAAGDEVVAQFQPEVAAGDAARVHRDPGPTAASPPNGV